MRDYHYSNRIMELYEFHRKYLFNNLDRDHYYDLFEWFDWRDDWVTQNTRPQIKEYIDAAIDDRSV